MKALSSFAENVKAQSSLLTGLKAYWGLDETSGNAIDSHDNHDGTVGTGLTRGQTGVLNNAYWFNMQSTAAVDVGPISTGGDKTASISASAKAESTSNMAYRKIIGRYYWHFTIGVSSGNKWEGRWNDNTFSSTISPDTEWHHFVLTYDGNLATQNLKLYIDGRYRPQELLRLIQLKRIITGRSDLMVIIPVTGMD